MKHKLVGPAGQIQEKICSNHDKLLEVYCRTDQQCVCVLCMMEEHKNHEIVSAATERTERQKQLGATLLKSQQRIQGRVKKWQDLKQAVAAVKNSAQTAIEENERIFTELVRSVQRWHAEVKQQVLAQERAVVTRATALLHQLEQEVSELRRRHVELEQLSHSDDHIHFLQSWQMLSSPSGYEDISSINVDPHSSFGPTKKAISELKERLEETCKGELANISATVKEVNVLQADEPRTREDFLQHSCELRLDPNTVHRSLRLLEGNTALEMVSEPLPYPDHPGRFANWQQALCREGLSGRRWYWEVDWKGTEVDIAVSYKGISRKSSGNECNFGWNDKSWSLYCSEAKCAFVHNNASTTVPFPGSSRIGVFLDFRAGNLAFYSVTDTMTLIHKVQTTFTEALYPGFGVWGFGSTVKIF
ncbi:tripartite motif-containing protein 16-like [Anguilla rostrata]|uniref:tripartite motif-containing protein 16-like n=1 Tax=Anguilla rostrata TaxID=7938 RepID=UPI0030CD5984